MKPIVSVIITVYNRCEYIREAIKSVLEQSYKKYEIIVVDDGSTIDIKKVLEPFKNKFEYRRQKHKGLAVARNTGIKVSFGEYIAFLDDDDLFEPNKLAVQSKVLANNSKVGFVYSDCYEFFDNNKDKLRLNLAIGRNGPNDQFPKSFFLNPNIRIPAVLFRKKCFDDAGWFDENLVQHEDGDMLLRIALSWTVKFSDYPSAKVRHHTNNMSSDRIEMNKSLIKSSKKNLTLFPEFKKSLRFTATKRSFQLYYQLGKACLSETIKRTIGKL